MPLTDRQQAYLMFLAFVLPQVGTWLGNGAPIDRLTLGILGASVGGGVLAFIKEDLSKGGLSNKAQAYLMLAAFVVPALLVWLQAGFPTTKVALTALAGSVLSGVIAYIKDILGGKPAPSSGTVSSTPSG